MKLAVDPAYFAPHDAASESIDVEQYLDSVLDLTTAVRQGLVEPLVGDGLMEWLADAGLLPLRETVGGLLKRRGITWITPHDLANALLGLIQRAHPLDEGFIASLDASESSISDETQLGEYCECHPVLAERFLELCSLSALRANPSLLLNGGVHAVLSPRPHDTGTIRGRYRFTEYLSEDQEFPHLTGTMHLVVVGGTLDVLNSLDVAHIAACELRAGMAPSNGIAATSVQSRGLLIDLPASVFGTQFVNDLKHPSVIANDGLLRKVMRAAYEIISGTASEKSHALRVSAGGSSAQLSQGDQSAMRHDVDHDYHLHYWKGPHGSVQLASMKTHNNFAIPRWEPS